MQELLHGLRDRLTRLGDRLDLAQLQEELRRLEQEMATPGFWEDGARAKEVSRRLEGQRALLQGYREIEEELEELEVLQELAEEEGDDRELRALEARAAELSQRIDEFELRVFLKGEYDRNDCYLSINAGAGGTDAQDWAEMLLRMYLRFLERRGFRAQLLEVSPGEEAGIKSAMIDVKGDYAYGWLKGERGVHRLVRISPFDAAHRRHTSFASVNVIPQVENAEVELDEDDLRIETYRASSAGGQHVNVTDSAVRITHLPTEITVQCQNERSQHQNKETALKILRSRLHELFHRQREEELRQLQGELKKIEWGSQIRSYVLHPYRLVKDHRTGVEVGNVEAVLDGALDEFIEGYLRSGGER
ncbi:MAG: peptide chain release factor 2 [Candidatus Bipolaricaulia bacterium]